MDYLIDEKDFIAYEAEIILSGCLKNFLIPNIYREQGKVYWVYPECEGARLYDYTTEDISFIQRLSKSYMLNPNNIIFHPDYIFKNEGCWMYHYLPSRRRILYEDGDLKRYLALERRSASLPIEVRNAESVSAQSIRSESSHILYNRNTGEAEKLLLKNTYIGGRRGKIDVDFSGELKINRDGNVVLLSGEAYLNHRIMELKKVYSLCSGDHIRCNQTEFLYW